MIEAHHKKNSPVPGLHEVRIPGRGGGSRSFSWTAALRQMSGAVTETMGLGTCGHETSRTLRGRRSKRTTLSFSMRFPRRGAVAVLGGLIPPSSFDEGSRFQDHVGGRKGKWAEN